MAKNADRRLSKKISLQPTRRRELVTYLAPVSGAGMADAKCGEGRVIFNQTGAVNLQDRIVQFQVDSVFLPEPQELLLELHRNDVLQGRVVDLSDSGGQREAYAVVQVDGVARPLLVPVTSLLDS